ncbi:MAG: hypothetical protein KBD55_02250 [Candidatus Pacebacteria bacterium]|nr:hypothetical protein [Candidatus Paceibacterota bacterium]
MMANKEKIVERWKCLKSIRGTHEWIYPKKNERKGPVSWCKWCNKTSKITRDKRIAQEWKFLEEYKKKNPNYISNRTDSIH